MMRLSCLLLLPGLALNLAAQEPPSADGLLMTPNSSEESSKDDQAHHPLPPMPDDELFAEEELPEASQEDGTAPSAAEDPIARHIARGVQLLESLEAMIASVGDRESADKVADKLGLLSRELQKWVQGFAALPALDEEEGRAYCDRYLSTVRDLNDRIREQGSRLSAAQYYGSVKLAQELQRLVLTMRK